MKAWLLFSFLVLAAGLKAQTPTPEAPAVNPTATAEEALATVYSELKLVRTTPNKETTPAAKLEAIRIELEELRYQFNLHKEEHAKWKQSAMSAWESEDKIIATSEANYKAATEWKETAEKWKEIALHNQRVAQENARMAQDNAAIATASNYQQPASKKASPFIHVINTAEGHWMTTDGTQIIKTGAGQATIIRP